MFFDKDKLLIAMYPEDAIYHLTIKFLVENESYVNPNQEHPDEYKPFSFTCAIPEDDSQNDLLARLITYLCRKCNHNKYSSLANRICIARFILFLLQRDNDISPDLTSINQKIDETQSKEIPSKFEFTDLDFNKKNPRETLTKVLADFMRITTGDVSPRRRGSILGRTLSSTGSQIKDAATAVRDASPFSSKTRSRRGSIVNAATPPSPTPPPSSLPSSRPPTSSMSSTNPSLSEFTPIPVEDDEQRQAVEERQPLLKTAANKSNSRTSPPKAPEGSSAFFQKGILNDPQDAVKIHQPYEIGTKQTAFTTSYDKQNDRMTIYCADVRLLDLLKGTLEKYITVKLFNKNVIQFTYQDLLKQQVNLNLILPIVFKGLPEAMDKSAKGEIGHQTHSIKKEKGLNINDETDDEKKSRCCSCFPCC